MPAIVATDDTLTIVPGKTADLLANDTYAGAPAKAGAGGNVSLTVAPDALPAGVTVTDGTVAVPAAAAPASFTFSYKICAVLFDSVCATASTRITVPPPAILATADVLTLAPGATGDLLANDTLGGAPATAATVTASAATLPAGVQVSAAGLISVGTGATPGSYPFSYGICQTSLPSNCSSASVTLTVPSTGLLSGRAVDSSTGAGVAGVTVTVGSATAITDAGGNFSIANGPTSGSATVLFTSPAYAPTARIVAIAGSGSTDVQARLVPLSASSTVDIATGGTASAAGSTARLSLLANSLQRPDGSLATGNIAVSLTRLDPSSDVSVMPGDFTTLVSGAAVPIESFGAVDVQLRDAAGLALKWLAGQAATLRIPVGTRSPSTPATAPLFYFDNATGRWVQEGTAALSTGGDYYEGPISRSGTWNADQTYDTVRISGCVATAAGLPVAGATVAADGIDYSSITSATTDASGNFVLPIRKNSQAAVTGVSSGRLTNTVRMGPYSADTTVSTCLALGDAGAGITMKLTWGASPSDLDSHLFTPSGEEVYYGNKGNLVAEPFANLDVDDVSSFGPEVVTVTKLMVGTYKYSVLNFSGTGTDAIGASGARVELNIPGRAVELFAPPTTGQSSATNWWNLFEFDVAANCTVTLRRVATFSATAPTPALITTPVYCTAP